ncbi:lipopolysaccharide biosynthesis protein [Occallatibacter riparius]|uniref:Oligosaccharide flippase family protein n=1 Tax=Occallatibacter riparius TaxID=1002689 RepID=A0A9J7BMK1_9BACT|nr:oligosaccharide flippase family protein [Occallatibacter riparius]UWZ83721.1 oligosaccharide flippase family protein [Occallatibacter riparius]
MTDSNVQNPIRKYLNRAFSSRIMKNASWMLCGQGVQLVGRMGYFVIIARALGPTAYGTFVACTALAATVAPFASCGTGNVLIKYVAKDSGVLRRYFGTTLLTTVFCGLLLTLLLLALRAFVLPPTATVGMVIAIVIADVFANEVIGLCMYAFLALEQGRRYSYLATVTTGVRLLAALVLLVVTPTATHWAYLYALSAAVAATIGLITICMLCGLPKFEFRSVVPAVKEGIHFATALSSQSIYNDIDKTMLARIASPAAAAIYAVAYRFIEPAILPIRSLGAASFPEFFRRGERGVRETLNLAISILRRSTLYGIAMAVGLFLGASLIPLVLGQAYAESTIALRWLCLLPAFKCVHIFLSDALTGANFQWQTSSAQLSVCVFNILVNLWIIRAFAWRGAAWSSLMTDGLLIVLLYLIIRWHLGRERRNPPAPATVAELGLTNS